MFLQKYQKTYRHDLLYTDVMDIEQSILRGNVGQCFHRSLNLLKIEQITLWYLEIIGSSIGKECIIIIWSIQGRSYTFHLLRNTSNIWLVGWLCINVVFRHISVNKKCRDKETISLANRGQANPCMSTTTPKFVFMLTKNLSITLLIHVIKNRKLRVFPY